VGLFDSFMLEEMSSNCGEKVENEFHMNALVSCALGEMIIKDGITKGYSGWCSNCEALLAGDVVIKDEASLGVR